MANDELTYINNLETDQFNPAKHVSEFEELASVSDDQLHKHELTSFSRLLSHEKIQKIYQDFQKNDKSSINHQNVFKSRANTGLYLSLIMIGFSTVIVIIDPALVLFDIEYEKTIIIKCLSILSAISGIMALGFFKKSKEQLKAYQKGRQEAERLRLAYFQIISDQTSKSDVSTTISFEYINRFLLQDQIKFYTERARAQEEDASKLSKIAGCILIIGLVLQFLAPYFDYSSIVIIVGGFVLFLKALAESFKAKENLQQHQTTSEIYKATLANLKLIDEDLEQIRTHLRNGQSEKLTQFVAMVTDGLKSEHAQWQTYFKDRLKQLNALEAQATPGQSKSP